MANFRFFVAALVALPLVNGCLDACAPSVDDAGSRDDGGRRDDAGLDDDGGAVDDGGGAPDDAGVSDDGGGLSVLDAGLGLFDGGEDAGGFGVQDAGGNAVDGGAPRLWPLVEACLAPFPLPGSSIYGEGAACTAQLIGDPVELAPSDCPHGLVCVPTPWTLYEGTCRVECGIGPPNAFEGVDPSLCPADRTCQVVLPLSSALYFGPAGAACLPQQRQRENHCFGPLDENACAHGMTCQVPGYMVWDWGQGADTRCIVPCDLGAEDAGCPDDDGCFARGPDPLELQTPGLTDLTDVSRCEVALCEQDPSTCPCDAARGFRCEALERWGGDERCVRRMGGCGIAPDAVPPGCDVPPFTFDAGVATSPLRAVRSMSGVFGAHLASTTDGYAGLYSWYGSTSIDVDGGTIWLDGGAQDVHGVFYARSSADGTVVARTAYENTNSLYDVTIVALATTPDDGAYLCAHHGGTLDFAPGADGGAFTSLPSSTAVVAKVDRDGAFVWGRAFSGASAVQCGRIAAVGAEGVVVGVGGAAGMNVVDEHGVVHGAVAASGALASGALLRLDAAGTVVWSRALVGSGNGGGGGGTLSARTDGVVVIAGGGRVTYGAGDPDELVVGDASDAIAWVLRVAADGSPTDAVVLPSHEGMQINDVLALDEGGFVVAGTFLIDAALDPRFPELATFTTLGAEDGFVAWYDEDGALMHAAQMGGRRSLYRPVFAAGGTADDVVVGAHPSLSWTGSSSPWTVVSGGGLQVDVSGESDGDGMIARFGAGAAPRAVDFLGGPGDDGLISLARLPDDGVVVAMRVAQGGRVNDVSLDAVCGDACGLVLAHFGAAPPLPDGFPVEDAGIIREGAPPVPDPCAGMTTHDGNATLADDAAVDAFATIECVHGHLWLGAGVVDADLPALRRIAGDLFAWTAQQLSSLSLPALEQVDGSILIQPEAPLATLSLPSLVEVGGELRLDGYDGLTSFAAPALASVGLLSFAYAGALAVNVPSLVTIDRLAINGPWSGDLSAFASVQTIGALGVYDATGILLGGLGANVVIDTLAIGSTHDLNDLDGLELVVVLGDDLQLYNNDALTSLAALGSLTRVDGSFAVVGNPSLPSCEATGLFAQLLAADGVGGTVSITGNAVGCGEDGGTPPVDDAGVAVDAGD